MGFPFRSRYFNGRCLKIRIVHVSDHFYPVLGYQETFLTRAQAKLGHEVYVVTSDRHSRFIYKHNKSLLGERIKEAGFFEEEGIKVWRLKTLFEISHAIWVIGLESKIWELKPDIVIVHNIVTLTALRVARLKKKRGNFKLIYDDHATFDNSKSKLYPLFKWAFSQLIQDAADALVAVGYPSKVFMNRKYGIPLERISVIPLGADDKLFRFDATARQEVRSYLSLKENDIVFIYTGKVIPEKRLGLLVEAMKLMRNYNNVKVLLVGNGPQTYIQEVKENIKAENLEDRFIWHGAVPNKELYKFYSAADVAVWPAGASISMLEAMACRLPIIVSDSPNINEMTYVSNQSTYQGDDPSDLARQMAMLLDPELRKQMRDNGKRCVAERLNWRVIAKQFIELVEPV